MNRLLVTGAMLAALATGLTSIPGCGSATRSSPEVEVTPTSPQLKTILEDVARSGELGSGTDMLAQEIEALKQTDPAKGAELEKDFEQLKSLTGEPAKKKAAEMAAKL